jgi:hypothetical protein
MKRIRPLAHCPVPHLVHRVRDPRPRPHRDRRPAILQANNVRDIENDRRDHKWRLAALASRPVADYEFLVLVLGPYGIVMVIADAASRLVLAQTAGLHMVFGGLLAFGFSLATWIGAA